MDRTIIGKYISEGVDKAKAGEAVAIYRNIVNSVEFSAIPEKSHYGMGWIVYYALHQSADHEIAERKKMLACYLNLSVTKPHKLHSMILTEAIRLYKNAQDAAFGKKRDEIVAFSIVKFCRIWNLTNLRPGDKRRKEVEGKMLPSTVEKLLTATVDEIENDNSLFDAAYIALADEMLAIYPDSFNLYAQRASLCAMEGNLERAAEMMKKAVLLAPTKFFLWSKLAKYVGAGKDPNLYISLLYKALKSPGPEQFKGKIRLTLAKVLADRKAFPQALWELQQMKRIYDANGWHLSPTYQQIQKIIPGETVASDPSAAYKRIEYLAEDYIYSGLPFVTMKKSFHKLPDPNKKFPNSRPTIAWRVTDQSGANVWFTPEHHHIDPNLPIGTSVRVKVYNSRVVKAEIES